MEKVPCPICDAPDTVSLTIWEQAVYIGEGDDVLGAKVVVIGSRLLLKSEDIEKILDQVTIKIAKQITKNLNNDQKQ